MNHRTHIPLHIISKTKSSPRSLARRWKKHAEISAAVAVVVELNTPLASPPLINKTSKCFGRKRVGGQASLPASHFPLNALWTLCLCFDTTHTHTHTHTQCFSPFGTPPRIHSENIHAYSETCNLPRVCTA